MGRAASFEHTYLRLEQLYAISRLLTQIRDVEGTISEVLDLAGKTLPIHTAVLIFESEGEPRMTAWRTEGVSSARLHDMLVNARASYAYLRGAVSAGTLDRDAARIEAGGLHDAAAPAREADGGARDFIVLPLALDRQTIFGALQLQPATLDEPALAFVNALVNMVAVALDRHLVWQRDRALRERAEADRATAETLQTRYGAIAAALRESEERRRLTMESTGVGAWELDPVTGVITCDARCKALYGLPPDARVDEAILRAAVHPEDRERVGEAVARALDPAGGGELVIESRTIGLVDGVERWVATRGHVFFDAARRPVRALGVVLDVTARRQAEEAIRLSEAKLAGIVSLAADAIISVDEAQRITLFNESAEVIFGYARDEVIGQPLDMLLPERSRATHRLRVLGFAQDEARARRMGARMEIHGRRKNGEEFPAEASISRLEAGGKWIFTAVLRDVTERKRAEREQRLFADVGAILAPSLDYREALASVARLAVGGLADCCIVDMVEEDGRVLRLTVVHADPQRAELANELSRMSLDMRGPLTGAEVLATGRSVLVPEVPPGYLESVSQSEEHLRVLQALAPRSLMAVPLAARGKLVGAMVFLSSSPGRRYDARDVRLAEELGRRAALAVDNARLYQQARRAALARDEVLSVVAHDLRTSVSTVALAGGLLLRRAEITASDAARRPVEAIGRAAQRMNHLIQDLLDVVAMEEGRISMTYAPHPPSRLVAEVVEALGPTIAAASLELVLDVEEDLPMVQADRDRIFQVFSNLIGNALKFTRPGGRVTLGAQRSGDEVHFRIVDTGPGIPEEIRPHLFERFWQAKVGDRRGAGLGLTICRGIVNAHGGRIWVESEPGQGSTFLFSLPVAPEQAEQAATTAAG